MSEEHLRVAMVGLLALIVMFAVAWLVLRGDRAWQSARRSRVARARGQRASAGERRAALLLESAGFELIGAQVPARYPLLVDGEAQTFDVRADYLVVKNGRTWVAEVKTGASGSAQSSALK